MVKKRNLFKIRISVCYQAVQYMATKKNRFYDFRAYVKYTLVVEPPQDHQKQNNIRR